MNLSIVLLFGSLTLNVVLFSMLIFSKNESDEKIKDCDNIKEDDYKYDAKNRKLYVNNSLYRSFTVNSCNHKVFMYVLENNKSDYDIAQNLVYESSREWSIKSTLYNLNLPRGFIAIRATHYELLVNVEVI